MRHLIIGGGGFIGSNLCARLLADGDEPIAFDARTSSVLPQLVGEDMAQQIFVHGDATDGLAVLEAAKSRGADTIINVLTGGSGNLRDYLHLIVDSFINTLEVTRILGMERVVYASSGSVVINYGQDDFVTANSYWPEDTYGGGKILIELIAKHYATFQGIDSAGFRIPLILGPGLTPGIAPPTDDSNPHPDAVVIAGLHDLLDKPKRGLPVRMPFADDVHEWMWADDVARGFALAARSSLHGARIYYIDGDLRPVREAIETVRRLIPGADIEAVPGKHGIIRPNVDLQPIREDLGWNGPEWRMEDIIAWYLGVEPQAPVG
jgi:nucleoside-diphosphate-sugar epimerase